MRPDRGRWAVPGEAGRYAEALRVATEAALAAGQRLRAEFHRPGGPRGAGEHADVDEEVERDEIRPRLTTSFPGWGYRGEETRPHRAPHDDAGHVWLVDPNDGTRAFLRGHRGTAVSIGLLRDGLPVLGVLYAYVYPDDMGDLLTWAEGEPLRRNGEVVERAVEDRPLARGDRVLVSESAELSPRANLRCVAPARFLAVPSIAYRLGLAAVGDGRATVSISGPGDWDYGAGHALLRAVGGELLGGDGAPVWYTRQGESHVAKGWAFGGDPAVVQALWERDWDTVRERPPLDGPFPSLRPRSGATAADGAALARAQGCLLGVFVGDALGAQVEFSRRAELRTRFPDGVRELSDGGAWNLVAGQPTDDSELALMLARTILGEGRYDPDAAARAYRWWLDSRPFDVGIATQRALSAVPRDGRGAAEAAREAADRGTQANGSLMRVAPLAIWGWRLSVERLAELAREESRLTHPHPICRDAVAAYCLAVAHAIRGGGPGLSAYRVALAWAEREADAAVAEALRAAAERPEWQPEMDGWDSGWVLHALRNAFHQLLFAPSFEEGLVQTIEQGGDTDTTAAIAGGLLGAVHGRAAIPRRWQLEVLSCRPLQGFWAHHPRPQPLWPVEALQMAEALLVAGQAAEP